MSKMNYSTRKMIVISGMGFIARMSTSQVFAGLYFSISLILFLGMVESNLEFIAVAAINLVFATININKSWKSIRI